MSRRRLALGRVSVYLEPRDLWIGTYIADDAVYLCPLPTLVVRIRRRPQPGRGPARNVAVDGCRVCRVKPGERHWARICDANRRAARWTYRLVYNGTFLATRHCARIVRVQIGLRDDLAVTGVVLDFIGVEAITVAFADELVCPLADLGFVIRIDGANPEVRAALVTALERRGIGTEMISNG